VETDNLRLWTSRSWSYWSYFFKIFVPIRKENMKTMACAVAEASCLVDDWRISGSRVLMLSAPTSGTYNGLLLFQSRSDFKAMSFSGSTGSDVRGIIYAPNAALSYSGSTGTIFHTDLVVDSLTITGSATIHSDSSSQ
jgi:hypothetical protein